MRFTAGEYDVAVIGAGHAGVEAALAAARIGCRTLLATLSMDNIALMPCNPSIGGPAKGHLVREVDALGGEMGINADKTAIQFRRLNTGKGPAVQALRAQADKKLYQFTMKEICERQKNLDVKQLLIEDILIENGAVRGVAVETGEVYYAKAVILATGTYLRGRVIIGETVYDSGPNGQRPAMALTGSLQSAGVRLMRFKTGTPARVDARSLDFSRMEKQPGDDGAPNFSFMTDAGARLTEQRPCWLTYTNEATHKILRENLHRAPMANGVIKGVGPRYCPSIETKIARFPDKDRHQIFIEPEGLSTNEMYVGGMSSSLPEDVQHEMYRTLPGLEHVKIVRNAYAIEYDCIDANNLYASLEFKAMKGLFSGGQFNGSSGYEEAACQGLIAGINAAMEIEGRDPLILDRSEAYIGVLIDDLVTKKNREPYRMMTSRAEYRLLLRQDNADLRLTKKGYEIGLISQERYDWVCKKEELIKKEIERVNEVKLGANARVQNVLEQYGSIPLHTGTTLSDLIRRPELDYDKLAEIDTDRPDLPAEVTEQVNILIKYDGYISRQIKQVEKFKKLEKKKLPEKFDYNEISGLRIEAQQKLKEFQPLNIGQASRISGVTPADISVLLVYLEQLKYSNPDLFFKLNPDEQKEKQE